MNTGDFLRTDPVTTVVVNSGSANHCPTQVSHFESGPLVKGLAMKRNRAFDGVVGVGNRPHVVFAQSSSLRT